MSAPLFVPAAATQPTQAISQARPAARPSYGPVLAPPPPPPPHRYSPYQTTASGRTYYPSGTTWAPPFQPPPPTPSQEDLNALRLATELLTIYYTHFPAFSPFPTHSLHHRPHLQIRPDATAYPWINDQPPFDPHGLQPQYPPTGNPPFPFYAYWGRDLRQGAYLPYMLINAGPRLPCFQLAPEGDHVDYGWGMGVRVADAFVEIFTRFDREYLALVVRDTERRRREE